MMLTEFLTARIAEDEDAARKSAADLDPVWGHYGSDGPTGTLALAISEGADEEHGTHFARWLPARVLAECEAKRRIVGLHGSYDRAFYNRATSTHESAGLACDLCLDRDDYGDVVVPWPCVTLRLLALPYNDHPDYDEAWRP